MNIAQFANAIIKAPNWQRLQFTFQNHQLAYITGMHLDQNGNILLEAGDINSPYVNCLDLLRMIQKLTEYKTIPRTADDGTSMAANVYFGARAVTELIIDNKQPVIHVETESSAVA